MPFMDEQVQFLRTEGVITTNVFISTKPTLPSGDGPYLSIFDGPGMAIERTQDGGYQRPAAMMVSRAKTYEAAFGLVQATYGAYIDRLTGKLKVINRLVGAVTFSVTSMTRSGTVVTVTTAAAHHFLSGKRVVIEGAGQPEYLGEQVITVTEPTKFTFAVVGSPVTPATGTILAKFLGTFYREIAPDQEPYDLGLDSNERVRLAFNISAVKYPS